MTAVIIPTVIVPTLHNPPDVTMIDMRLRLSLRKKRLGDPEQPQVINDQALLLLDIETLLPCLTGKAQLVPQSVWHSVLELILPRVQYRLRVLMHHFHTLGAKGGVPGWYTANTLQGHGQSTHYILAWALGVHS